MKFVIMKSNRIETHTPNPVAAICRIWLSLRGCASKMCTIFNEIGSTIKILLRCAAHILSATIHRQRTDCFGNPNVTYKI